jgi:hypothetical protein
MKYSQELVWQAVGVIVPSLLEARELGVSINLPTALNLAAVDCFLISETTEFKISFRKTAAALVIRTALQELHTNGQLEFGTQDKLW